MGSLAEVMSGIKLIDTFLRRLLKAVAQCALAGVEYTFSHQKFTKMPERLQIIPMVDIQSIW
jgi:hypothetical protein